MTQQTMQIEIINVAVTQVPTAKGSYGRAEVTYKNKSYQDKVESKPIMDFSAKDVFNTLKDSKFGDQFTILREKNDKGFWDWKKIVTEADQAMFNEEEKKNRSISSMATPTANTSPRSTYETADERAARQVLIVRQSSVSSAIAALKTEKVQLDANQIVDLARQLEAYVMKDMGGTDKFAGLVEDPM